MERGLLMGDNRKRSDPIIASKSVGSFVKIDSISIDLADANDKSSSHAGKCEHFTIRGYVSEIRKKNWKLCWPFASDADLNKFDQEQTSMLPPLNTPSFRLWSCQNCVPPTGSKRIAKDNGTGINSCDIGSNSNKTCAQMPLSGDAPMLLSCSQQSPKSKIVEGKNVEAYTSTIGSGNEQHPSSCTTDKKEGNGEVAPTITTANENTLEDYVSHEMPRFNFFGTEVNPKRMQGRQKDDTGAITLEGNGSAEVCKPGCESHEDANVAIDIANKKFWNKNSSQTSEAECQTSAEDHQKESMNASGTCKTAGMVDKADNATKVQTDVNHPLVLDECDYTASENLDKSSGLNRKRSRKKVRLLSELWKKGDAKSDCIRIEDSPPYTNSNTSGAGTVSQIQVPVQENARAGLSESVMNKRKLPEEEEQGCLEMTRPKSLNKKVKASKRDEETTDAIGNSELEEDSVARISLQADGKSNWNRYEIERIPATGKKKTKKSNFGACSSLVPPEDSMPIEALDKVGNSSKGNATKSSTFSLTYDASKSRWIDQIPFPASKSEGKSGFCKRKGKTPQVDNGEATLFPWTDMLRKDPKTRKDVEIMQTGHPFPLAKGASSEKGLDLSLNSYMAAHRCDRKSIPQSENGFPSLSTWKDGSCKLDEFMRKNVEANYAANLYKPESVSNAFFGKGVPGELCSNSYTYSISGPILNEKQNYSSQVEQGSCSLQKMDMSRARNKEKIIEVQKNSAVPVSRKRSSHRAEKMSQQGVADDIPMEIVELMAKNQYERTQPDDGKHKHILAANSQVVDHNYGIGDLRISEETSQKRKSQVGNAKKGLTTRKNVLPSKQNSVDYSTYINGKDFGVSRLDQMHCPTGFSAFSQSQKKVSARDQFPATDYGRCSCAQNCKWTGDMMGHGFSHSSLRTLAACNTRQSVPQAKEEAGRLWSSVMPVHMPLTYNNPQKCPGQPSNVSMLSHTPGSLHKGNVNGDYDLQFFNLNATQHKKHSEEVGSEAFSRKNAEYSFTCKHQGTEPHQNSMGSLDLYSNETIPAMHLLSLMDAGMRSGAPFNMDGNQKFLKRPFPYDLNSKEHSGLDTGAYRATDTVKHPSSSFCGKNHLSEKSLDLFPVHPTGDASTSFQHSKGFKRAADFMSQVSLSSQKKEKLQSSSAPAQNRGPGSQKATCTAGGLGKNNGTIPVLSVQKGFLTVSDPPMFPQKYHALGTMKPPKSSSETLICLVNKNPADFSLPEEGNEYMIKGEELKVGKQISFEKRLGLIKVDQKKRQRNKKQTTGKERAQQ